MELAFGQGPETLPLDKVQTIHTGNALTIDWASIVLPTDQLYVLGNPPFLGHATRSPEQAAELRAVWRRDDIGRLDYVTGWYIKTLDLFNQAGYDGQFAFVSTNSITQGEPVPALFDTVFKAGWRIKFAHRTFAWSSEAPRAAAVHCVIVGFDKHPRSPAWLYDYTDPKGEPQPVTVNQRINGYLVDGPNVLVNQRREVLAVDLPEFTFGNMPRDDGGLVVEAADYPAVAADPIAAQYLRRYVGSRELIHDLPRWCLWLVDLDPCEVDRSPVLRTRLAKVRAFRAASTAQSTRQMAQTPHLFGQRSQPSTAYVGVPRVASEHRDYFLAQRYSADVIISDGAFRSPDPDGLAFAVISSSMFITWQRAVGGRLKSDLRFSNTLVWNTFPLPGLDTATRTKLIQAGQAILTARALHPERSLADHYNPLAMTPELLHAHHQLDQIMDRAIGAKTTCPTNTDHLTHLFASYAKLVAEPTLKLGGKPLRGNWPRPEQRRQSGLLPQ